MSWKKSLVLGGVLLLSVSASIVLIWHGLNLDRQQEERPQVLGDQKLQTATASAQISASPTAIQNNNSYLVSKVIDGDTFEVKTASQTFKVRMIGIDTPETVDPRRPVGCFGKKASEETRRLIEGKNVILAKDVSETDKYRRLLRYVYLPIGEGNNLFVNDYLIRQGFATTLTYPPDIKYDKRFLEAEKEARNNLRGLWAECK